MDSPIAVANIKKPLKSGLSRSNALEESFNLANWRVIPCLNRLEKLATHAPSNQLAPNQPIKSLMLEPRLMHLLCYLAANPHQLLTRQELQDELWPSVIVNDNSLTKAISALRQKLKQLDGGACELIQTVPKKGYLINVVAETIPAQLRLDQEHLSAGIPPLSEAPALVTSNQAKRFTYLGIRSSKPAFDLAASVILALSLITALTGFKPSQPTTSYVAETHSNTSGIEMSDQVVDHFWGGFSSAFKEVGLIEHASLDSAALDSALLRHNLAQAAILSADNNSIAYIKYDHLGSSILIANSDKPEAYTRIFNSPDYLYNLSWSPVGHALLFAKASSFKLLTVASLSSVLNDSVLMQLDLESLELKQLFESEPKSVTPKIEGSSSFHNLT